MSTITVATADLRQALLAVAPHADKSPEEEILDRVRLSVGPENIYVSATNRYSAALALVSVEEHDGELVDIDLSCQDVKEILALFKPGKEDGGELGATLELTTTKEHFTVTDTSGLFPGKSLSLPKFPKANNFPDLNKIAWSSLTKPAPEEHVERLATKGELLSLFKSAATAYGEPLVLEMTGEKSSLIVSCGESFLGFLTPIRQDGIERDQSDRWRSRWVHRLEEIVGMPTAA